jgi:release factor glutamine methyltransferase
LALDGGQDGLDLVRPLAEGAFAALAPGGVLLVETGEYNAALAAEWFKRCGFIGIVTHRDLAGQDRVVEGRKP